MPSLESFAQSNPNLQLQLGDQVSIYSEKAYRKNQGKVFEAVGNVVIKSGQETIYGEKASFDIEKGEVFIEGNVRFISKNITIYGSNIRYFTSNSKVIVNDARVIAGGFNILASYIEKMEGDGVYLAKKAEFTTCKDCTESWTVYGDILNIELNQYVRIKNAMMKVKGVNVFYIPYIVLPIKNERESGLLFPLVTTRFDEGVSYQQPIYWAIDSDKDFTFSPSFWAKRGEGADLQYRQVFGEKKWLNYDQRFINDKIYQPGKLDRTLSGDSYFRHFIDLESHMQFGHDITSHFSFQGAKDIDILRDYQNYTNEKTYSSDLGGSGFVEWRRHNFQIGTEAHKRRNLLFSNSEQEDRSYVQVAPSVYFNLSPQVLYQSDTLFLQNISFSFDSNYTLFRQDNTDEEVYLRNANRMDTQSRLNWQYFTHGAYSLKSMYTVDTQTYDFVDDEQSSFTKSTGFLLTEFSFGLERIFGLSYNERVPVDQVTKDYIDSLQAKQNKGKESIKESNTIGELPDFDSFLVEDTVPLRSNSYKHSQVFKFMHHYSNFSTENGNERFENQISSAQGWFDYRDAVLNDINRIGGNATRTLIPRTNTLELQWNHLLIKKTPKAYNAFEDNKYLRDNFSYQRTAFLNVSQGFVMDREEGDESDNILTRLAIDSGFAINQWNFRLTEFYFHDTNDFIFNGSVARRFDSANFFTRYNQTTFDEANLRTIGTGLQLRPIDSLGLSFMNDYDFVTGQNIRTTYQVDIMPDNNCWIIAFNYQRSLVDARLAMNFVFNFGNEDYALYKQNFYDFNRLNL